MDKIEALDDWANAEAHSAFDFAKDDLHYLDAEDVPPEIWIALEKALVDLGNWINTNGVRINAERRKEYDGFVLPAKKDTP